MILQVLPAKFTSTLCPNCRFSGVSGPGVSGRMSVRLTGPVLRVGLTGGIGAGKSEAARRLAAHGAVVVDADQLAREAVAPGTTGLAAVVERFGPGVLAPDGSLDRTALAALVFDDPPARRALERIVHPRVRARSAELVAAAPADAVVVHDVPLLVEAGLAATYHLVLVVSAPESTRLARLVSTRGMSPEQAQARIRAQASEEDRRAAADVLLANDGTLAHLHAQVDTVWRERLVPFEENLRLRRPAAPPAAEPVPYDPAWPNQYERLAARVRHALGDLLRHIDHVGPTSVPGQPAQDLIRIAVAVDDPVSPAVADALAGAGFMEVGPSGPSAAAAGEPVRVCASADPGRPAQVELHRASGWGDDRAARG